MLFVSTLFLIFGIIIQVNNVIGKSYSIRLERELQEHLFTNYSRLQRPSKQVIVKVTLSLLTINEMDIKDQTLSVSARLSLEWKDDRLMWKKNPHLIKDYSQIKYLFSYEEYLWRPPVFVENSVDNLSVLSDKHMPMRITSDGTVYWSPAGIFKVDCDSDITYYPLDYQTCEIKITTASYTQSEIRLKFPKIDSVSLKYFSQNGEWDLRTATEGRERIKQRRGQGFSSLPFVLSLRRRYLFHVMNTLFPVVLMALLIPMVFKLHVDSGEKIGYSLTVLLAYAVYLTLISEYIPSTSVSVCYLSIYLAFTFAVSMLSVLCVILVINVYYVPEDRPMPNYVRSLALNFLARVSCWNGYSCCCSPKTARQVQHRSNGMSQSTHFKHDEPTEREFTWTMLSSVLDNVFFCVFLILVLVSTFTYMYAVAAEYARY